MEVHPVNRCQRVPRHYTEWLEFSDHQTRYNCIAPLLKSDTLQSSFLNAV